MNVQPAARTLAAAFKRGREAIIDEIRSHFYVSLYEPGTARIVNERLISANGWVAAQFSLSGRTLSKGGAYENFYFFLYQLKDGQITRYWEYVDTAYANAQLFQGW